MSSTLVFPMIPAAVKATWFFAAVICVLIVPLVLLAWLAWSTQHARFTVSPEGLRLQGDLWGRHIPLRDLKLDEAVVTDLRQDVAHQPKRRTMGSALPGYSAGWFELRDGSKGLLYVTDRSRVVRLPTSEGYTLLLSVPEPQRLLDALRAQPGR
jgi:hypothetical protein